ncbi:cell wall protein RBR3-like [Haliotis rufescens]|uniref:cell wall protein RBR3-like n=1 Tax=Haliotis rufescens TaxID=6454 RepID=UPI00201E75F6|nr:cell wall protein RBR3-like [Haliotis rufescens]
MCVTAQVLVWSVLAILTKADRPFLSIDPVRVEEGSPFTLICTTTEKYIWYINWKRNAKDIFGLGPDTGLAKTNDDFESLKNRVVYSINPGKQYNVTLTSVTEADHGSSWTCRVRGEDSNSVLLMVGDLPLVSTTVPPSTMATSTSPTTTMTTTMNATTSTKSSTTTKPSSTTKTHVATSTTVASESTAERSTTAESSTTAENSTSTESTVQTFANGTSTPMTTIPIKRAARNSTSPATTSSPNFDFALIAAGVIGVIILLAVAFCIAVVVRRRRRDSYM